MNELRGGIIFNLKQMKWKLLNTQNRNLNTCQLPTRILIYHGKIKTSFQLKILLK